MSGSRPTVGRLSRACLAGSLWQAGRLAGNFARRLAAAARPIDSRASGPARVKPFVDSRYRRRAGRAETKVELCTLRPWPYPRSEKEHLLMKCKLAIRVTTCMENLEMSGILTAVSEMSGI